MSFQDNPKPKFITINGYRILYIKKPGNITSVMGFINNGMVDEKKDEAGISHLCEHILCRSWRKYKGSEIFEFLDSKGATYNAFTSTSYCGYYVYGNSKNTEDFITFISEIMTNPKIDENVMKEEKKAVREELLIYKDDPEHAVEAAISKTIYPNTGLEWNDNMDLCISNLDKLNIEELYNWNKTHYTKDTLLFSICTGKDLKYIKNILNKTLKSNDNSTTISKIYPRVDSETIRGKIIYVKREEASKTHIELSFLNDIKLDSVEQIKGEYISWILTKGLGSILSKELRGKYNLIYSISSELACNYWGGRMYISYSIKNENVQKSLNIIFNELDKIKNGEITDEHVQAVREKIISKEYNRCSTCMDYSYFWGFQALWSNTLRSPHEIMKILVNLKKPELVRIINKIFDYNKMFLVYQSNKKQNINLI